MTVSTEKVPANFVPAAAVIRRGQALLGIIGRKACVGGFIVESESLWLNQRIAYKTVKLEY